MAKEKGVNKTLVDVLNTALRKRQLALVLECHGFLYPFGKGWTPFHVAGDGPIRGTVLAIPIEAVTQALKKAADGLNKRNRIVNRWELAQIVPDFDAQLIKLRSTYGKEKAKEKKPKPK